MDTATCVYTVEPLALLTRTRTGSAPRVAMFAVTYAGSEQKAVRLRPLESQELIEKRKGAPSVGESVRLR